MKIIRNYILTILAVILLTALNLFAQNVRDKGIELYKQGDYSESVSILKKAVSQKEFEKDGETWNVLGLALLKQDKIKDGRKALEKAVKYAPNNSVFRSNLAYAYLMDKKINKAQSETQKAIQLDPKNSAAFYVRGTANFRENKPESAASDAKQSIALDPKFTAAYILQADSILSSFGRLWAEASKPRENLDLLETAAEALNKCLNECPKDDSMKIIETKLETVNAFTEYFSRTKDADDTQEEVVTDNGTPLKILSKPRAGYTDAARQNNEQGTVILGVLFGFDGKIKYIVPLKTLNYGLTEKALEAAAKMAFEPETKDGKPVSVVKAVQFSFTIY